MGVKSDLIEKIESRNALVGVIGLGYVGLPLAIGFAEKGFHVLGFDVDESKINDIGAGRSYISTISSEKLSPSVKKGLLKATSRFEELGKPDAIIICVPTPLTESKEPDLSFVINTAKEVSKHLRKGQLVSLESTTYPGTTREELLPLFEKELKVGKDFFLAFSPEREDPGNAKFTLSAIPKVVGGITKDCAEVASKLYSNVVKEVLQVSSPEAAEMEKLLENIFRSVNIALMNELKMLADRMGIDIWEVIAAASTKPFGFMPFYPGPGLGGHCIPLDPFYLSWKAKQYDFHTRFIELAGDINTYMPFYVVGNVAKALNEQGKCIKGSKILIMGVAYKKDVGDMRESPALKIIELLRERGAVVEYNDPFFPVMPKTRKYKYELKSKELTSSYLKGLDCVLIAANHSSYDYEFIAKNSKLIIDTRDSFRLVKLADKSNIFNS